MNKTVIIAFCFALTFVGCGKKEDVGNLKERVNQHISEKVAEAKSLGGDLIVTDTLVFNDSVCVFATISTHPKRSAIPFEYFFVRKRAKDKFEYYTKVDVANIWGKKSVKEKVYRELAIANTSTFTSVMSDEKTREAAYRILYTIANDECKQKLKDVKK